MVTRGAKNAIADMPESLDWRMATIARITPQSWRTSSYTLAIDGESISFRAGQHISVRLTAPGGYQAIRDYSISSPPSVNEIEITVAHDPHGEVSGWFHESAEVGDRIEIALNGARYFTWQPVASDSIALIAGGIGITPLMSMLRHARLASRDTKTTLLYSVRNPKEVIFGDEIQPRTTHETLAITYVESAPQDWTGHQGYADAAFLAPAANARIIYICGPGAFVLACGNILTGELQVPASHIRTESFG
jgi:ferredoxin-NADP reductase